MIAFVAHQGGWDEIALVAAPLAAFGAVLFLANRRANAKLARRPEPRTGPDAEAETSAETD